jgi:hypothetical protein
MLKGEGGSDEQQAAIRIFKFVSHFLKNHPQFMLLGTQDSKSLLLLLSQLKWLQLIIKVFLA